jgi:hypothetical protein
LPLFVSYNKKIVGTATALRAMGNTNEGVEVFITAKPKVEKFL